ELAVVEPADAEVLQFEAGVLDPGRRLHPVQPLGHLAPERIRLLQRLRVEALVFVAGDPGVGGERRLDRVDGGGWVHGALRWLAGPGRAGRPDGQFATSRDRGRDATWPVRGHHRHPSLPGGCLNYGNRNKGQDMETDIRVFDWDRLLLGLPPKLYMLEIAFKIVVIFAILMLVMRLMGKRGQRDLSPMQQMLLIALGSAAGDALLYPSVPLAYAALILVGVTLVTI